MAEIPVKFEAGAFDGSDRDVSPAKILRDIADDLAGISGSTGVSSPAVAAVTAAAIAAVAAAAPSAVATADGSDAGTTQTLANALKVQVNVIVTAVNELRTLEGTVRTALNELQTLHAAVRALVNELRTDAPASYTLKTTKAAT